MREMSEIMWLRGRFQELRPGLKLFSGMGLRLFEMCWWWWWEQGGECLCSGFEARAAGVEA